MLNYNIIYNPSLIFTVIITLYLLFIYYIFYWNKNHDINEHYDLEISDVTANECGTFCTEGLNCAGFSHKSIESKCYLSKTGILGKPIDSIYSDKYSKLDRRCNKINRILDDDIIDSRSLTQNSIYICTDGENNNPIEFQYAKFGSSALERTNSTIFDRSDDDIVKPDIVKYDTHIINWPTAINTKNTKILPLYPQLSINTNTNANTGNNNTGFIESDKEYLGQYLLSHQCVSNISFIDCLKYCKNNQSCIGTEWNKLFIKDNNDNYNYHENVCCPKSVIRQIIPRRKKYNNGKFYIKKNINELQNKNPIIITK